MKINSRVNISWQLIVIFIILVFGAGLAGSWYYSHLRKNIEQKAKDELFLIAELKTEHIVHWLKERLEDAAIIQLDESFSDDVKRALAGPLSSPAAYKVNKYLQIQKDTYGYMSVLFLNETGKIIFSCGEEKDRIGPNGLAALRKAREEKKSILSDIHQNEIIKKPHLDLSTPIIDKSSSKFLGIVLLRIDPAEFLFSSMRSWPTKSGSAEALLVEKKDGNVVFLNDLRHRKNDGALKLSLDKKNMPAVMAAQGYEGYFEGVDYRGVPVFSVIKKVPGTAWSLITKIDKSEAYEPLYSSTLMVSISGLSVILLLSTVIGFIWYRQETKHKREQYEQEIGRLLVYKQYETFVKFANDIIILSDEDANICDANERALSSHGYSREEFLKKHLFEVRPSYLKDKLDEVLENIKSKAEGMLYETLHLRKDGTTFPVEVNSRYIRVDSRQMCLSIIRDITERKRSNEILLERDEILIEAQKMANLGAYKTDIRNGFWTSSEILDEIFGIGPEYKRSVAGWVGLVHPDDRVMMENYFKDDVLGKKQTFYKEYRIVRMNDKQERWVLGLGNLKFDKAGEPELMVGVIQDITERKQSEKELHKYREGLEGLVNQRTSELKTANEKLKKYSQELETVNKELEAFTYSVSHDLRAPLRAIDGFSRILEEEYAKNLDAEGKRQLGIITGNVKRMSNLIDDLLRLSKEGQKAIQTEEIDMKDAVRTVIDKIKQELNRRKISFKVEDLPPALGDKSLIIQVLFNLISNSVKFTQNKENAVIEIGCKKGDKENIYWIKDNGAGFDMEYSNKLFGVFQRLHTQEEFDGTGIGLAIVKRIISKHSGKIWAEGKVNEGSIFYFSLPDKKLEQTA